MANERIGTAPCPLCGRAAGVTVSKSGLTVLTCNRCHCQLFTRSDASDGYLRDRITPAALPAGQAPAVAPVSPAETGGGKEEAAPTAPEVENVTPEPAGKSRSVWDIWG